MNNGGGNRGACLCKFPRTVISFMLNGQNSGAASENNLPPLFSLSTLLLALLCLASPPHRCSLCTHLLPAFIKREAERSESLKEYRSCYLPNHFSLTANQPRPSQRLQSFTPHFLGKPHSFFLSSSSIDSACFSCFFLPFICIFIVSLLASLSVSCPPIASVYIYFLISPPLYFAVIAVASPPPCILHCRVHKPHVVPG